jgi:hypothetical protein
MTNTELAEALRSITNLSPCELLVVRAAADALSEPGAEGEGWIAWYGGECPVDGGSYIEARLDGSWATIRLARDLDWSKDGMLAVKSYRLVR